MLYWRKFALKSFVRHCGISRHLMWGALPNFVNENERGYSSSQHEPVERREYAIDYDILIKKTEPFIASSKLIEFFSGISPFSSLWCDFITNKQILFIKWLISIFLKLVFTRQRLVLLGFSVFRAPQSGCTIQAEMVRFGYSKLESCYAVPVDFHSKTDRCKIVRKASSKPMSYPLIIFSDFHCHNMTASNIQISNTIIMRKTWSPWDIDIVRLGVEFFVSF